jgi:hypothetical protein
MLAVLMLASTSCGDDRDLLFIAVIPTNVTLGQQGSTVQFIANGVFNRGPDEDITRQVTWASALPQVASVNSTGLATAELVPNCFEASTVITASREGKTATASVRVTLAGTSLCP